MAQPVFRGTFVPMMRATSLAVVLLALYAAGCQRKQSATDVEAAGWSTSPIGRDLDRICNVVRYAGVEDRDSGEQLLATLDWLPRNIESEAGRDFLASIANLTGSAKADALDAGALKVGIKDCPISRRWRE